MCERNSRESVSAGGTINLRRAIRGVMLLMLVEMIVTRSAIFPHLGGHTGRRRPLSVPPTRRSCQKWFQKWHHRFKTFWEKVSVFRPVLTVRTVQIARRHGRACGRWTNKKGGREAGRQGGEAKREGPGQERESQEGREIGRQMKAEGGGHGCR